MLRTSASKARAQTPAFGAREISSDVENVRGSAFPRQHCHKMLIALYTPNKGNEIGQMPDTLVVHFLEFLAFLNEDSEKFPITNFSPWETIHFFLSKECSVPIAGAEIQRILDSVIDLLGNGIFHAEATIFATINLRVRIRS